MDPEFLVQRMKGVTMVPDLETRQRLSVGILVRAMTTGNMSHAQRLILVNVLKRNGDLEWELPDPLDMI